MTSPTDQPEDETPEQQHQRDLEELASLGVFPAPPTHWVYRQGTSFVIHGDGQDDESKQPVEWDVIEGGKPSASCVSDE